MPDRSQKRSRRALLVLGMHRSGTSLVSAMLCMAGADAPKTLQAGDVFNETGYWESPRVFGLNDEILAGIGCTWDTAMALPENFEKSHKVAGYYESIRGVLREQFGDSRLFCLKDPRISRLLPMWERVLDDEGVENDYVICFRNPLEVAESLRNRSLKKGGGNFPLSKSAMLWLRHTLEAEMHTRGKPRVFVSYDQVLDDWHGVVRLIAEHFDLTWPRRASQIDLDFERLIAPQLRHHRIPPETMGLRGGVADWITDTFFACLAAAQGNDDEASQTFDRVRAEVEKADKAFEPLLIAEQSATAAIQREAEALAACISERERDLNDVRAQCDKLVAQAEEQSAELARVRTQTEVLTAESSSAAKVLTNAKRDILVLRAELEAARQEASAKSGLADQWQLQLQENAAELGALRARHESELNDARVAANTLASDLQDLLQRYEATLAEAERLRAELSDVDVLKLNLQDLSRRYEDAQTDTERLRAELSDANALKSEFRDVSQRYEAAQADAERLRAQLSDVDVLKSNLQDISRRYEDAQTDIERLRAELSDANALRSDLRDVSQRYESARADTERLQMQVKSASIREATKDTVATQLRAQLDTAARRLRALDWDLQGAPKVISGASDVEAEPPGKPPQRKKPVGLCDISEWRIDIDAPSDEQDGFDGTIGVFVHLYYEELADEIASAIRNIPYRVHVYVSTDDTRKASLAESAFAGGGIDAVTCRVLPNAGHDIGPFLYGFRDEIRKHEFCLRLHSKKTAHQEPPFGSAWRRHIFHSLLGAPERVKAVIGAFTRYGDLGILMPEHWASIRGHLRIGENWDCFARLLERLDLFVDPEASIEFPSGSMFWFRSSAIEPLLELNLTSGDFALSGQNGRDFTMAHAIERLFLFVAAKAGLHWAFAPPLQQQEAFAPTSAPHDAPAVDTSSAAPVSARLSVTEAELEEIVRSGLFDEAYYKANAGGAALNGSAARHFAEIGAWEGRCPNRLFDPAYYLIRNADVAASGMNPLLHFMRDGWREGRRPHPNFDPAFYLARYSDVAAANVNPLLHYLEAGEREGRIPLDVDRFAGPPVEPYKAWLDVNSGSETEDRRLRAALSDAGDSLPRISVIMPVYRPPMQFLQEAVESVFQQIYQNWELCIHVDGDCDPALHRWLQALALRSDRVKLSISEKNEGISAATNAATVLATGEFLAFFDQDDLLTRSALAYMALAAAENPQTDLLYSDDDKVSASGERYAPQFKPDWAPVLLLSYMYMGHLHVVRRALFEELGGFRRGFEGSQDYDFALRASEKARAIVHVPEILYHWRAVPGSTATSGEAKPNSFVAGLRAVQEACNRRGIPARAVQPDWAVAAKCGIFSLVFPDYGPKVTIIIPTRNRLDLLKPCIESIASLTAYTNYEILIVDNESDDEQTVDYIATCGHRALRLGSPSGVFNFAYLMNQAVASAAGEFVLFLNNDTEVRSANWLSQMVGYAQMCGVGAVGAKLYFPDETIQHAGVIHGFYGGLAGPAFRNTPGYDYGYLSYAMVAREYSAVTAACLLSRRKTFLDAGGMDEKRFGVAYNDVDYCYRLVEAGYSCVYCPQAELTHYEGKSRGFHDNALEIANFRSVYRNFEDRWYSPHLTSEDERFSVRPAKYVAPQLKGTPLRVAMFSHNLNPEGAPNSMFELVAGLKAKGHVDPVVIAPDEGSLRSEYAKIGVPVEILGHPLRGAFDRDIYGERARRLAAALRQSGAELVYANTAETFWALDAARKGGLPAVWNIRESEPWATYYEGLPAFLQQIAYGSFYSAYRVIFVATSTRDLWSPLNGRHNFTVIQNGLDLERLRARSAGLTTQRARELLGVGDEEVVLVLVGTVCERKNQRVLVEAIGKMPVSAAASARVFIVGDRDSEYSRALHQDWEALPDEWRSKVQIVPETDQPYLYFNAADISLCTSARESYPRVVLEAMAFGKPLVTTPVYGITEQAQENVNALFFDPNDSDALKSALLQLIGDRPLRSKFARNSQALFDGLMQYDDMIARYAKIMREAALSGVVAAA